jgi:hypothetical protein
MNKLKYLYNVNNISVGLLILPYFIFNSSNIYNSRYYSIDKIILTFILIILLDYIIKMYAIKTKNNFIKTIILISFFIFFYGYYIILINQQILAKYFQIISRGGILLTFLIVTFLGCILFYKIKNYRPLNTFLIIFLITNLGFNNNLKKINNKYNSSVRNEKFIKSKNATNEFKKPIILIITDEYNSPDGLYKINKSMNIYNFSTFLRTKGWITNNNFYSYETSTIHSLSSLFNYNLSNDSNFKNNDINQIAYDKLLKASMIDSLHEKNVKIINYGIFDLGDSKPLSRLYFYPKSFIENIFTNTIVHLLRILFINNNLNYNKINYYPMQVHNKYIFTHLYDSVRKENNKNIFVYTHLYMPHNPIIYEPELKLKSNNLDNYIKYWEFTNNKLKVLLSELTKDKKYKIIITGDHGYKGDRRVNAQKTFAAFYGFDKSEIESIKSVQDLGFLINSSY